MPIRDVVECDRCPQEARLEATSDDLNGCWRARSGTGRTRSGEGSCAKLSTRGRDAADRKARTPPHPTPSARE
jgi:hypothetical protein